MREERMIIDMYSGEQVNVYYSERRLLAYDNSKRVAVYSAEAVEGGFFVDFIETKEITDIDERINSMHNPLKAVYAAAVRCHASANDPDRARWKKIVDRVKSNPSLFFNKKGDFRKNISIETYRKMLNEE